MAAVIAAAACSEPAPPPPPPAPPNTAETRAQRYQECWNQFNDKAWDKFQTCYTDTAVSESADSTPATFTGRPAIIERAKMEAGAFPDRRGEVRLVLVNNEHVASIAMYTGTNTGPLPPGPDGKPGPATGKPVGFLLAHMVDFDSTGMAAGREMAFVDEGTMMAQLGLSPAPARPAEKPNGMPATVVLAKNDATETANLAATSAMFVAVNKHDLKALAAMTPDTYRSIEIARPKDMDKKEALASTKEMFGAYPDVKITPTTMWAAGDYVVITGTFEGTNTGDMPSAQMKKTGKAVKARFCEIIKFENGKPKDDYLFYNGAAMAAQLGLK